MSEIQTHIFYIAIISLASLCIWYADFEKRKQIYVKTGAGKGFELPGCILFVLSYLILLLPLINRTCGKDTPQYYRTYVSGDTSGLDFTYYYLCKFMHSIIPDPKTGLGIISAVTLVLVYAAFLNVREYVSIRYAFLAYYTGIYFYLYNYMRIMIATSLIYVCFSFLVKSNRKKALYFAIAATLFHRSALVIILSLLVVFYFKNHRHLVIIGSVAGIGALLASPQFFFRLIHSERYTQYLTDSSIFENTHIGLGTTIKIVPFFFLLYWYRKYRQEPVYIATLYLTLANLAFSFLGYYVNSASRLSNMYFVFHLLFFVPWLISKEKTFHKNTLFLRAFYIGYCILNYYQLTFNFDAMTIIPYQ